jgi:hypothetical protein
MPSRGSPTVAMTSAPSVQVIVMTPQRTVVATMRTGADGRLKNTTVAR